MRTCECEYPLCEVITPSRYCITHERLFKRLQAEHQAVLLSVSGVTKANIAQYWRLPGTIQRNIRAEHGVR